MGIELTTVEHDQRSVTTVLGPVAHLGAHIPKGKPGVRLSGQGVANHHGKIFYAYGMHHYVNLTERPTHVFRGPTFSFQLDPLMPQCQIHEGDQLKLGTTILEITKLTSPHVRQGRRRAVVCGRLKYRRVPCRRCTPEKVCKVIGLTSELIDRLQGYTEPQEILRASVDWLCEVFRGGRRGGLTLSAAGAIVIRPRPGARRSRVGDPIPIEKGQADGLSAIDAVVKSPLKDEFDQGTALRFESSDGTVCGMAVGILQGVTADEATPQAGHLLIVRAPPGKKSTSDDTCVLHHAAGHITKLLALVGATRTHFRHELERRAARESHEMFHNMIGFCAGARDAVATARTLVRKDPKSVEAKLATAEGSLHELQEHVEEGLYRYARDYFHYDWADPKNLCQRVVDVLFGDSEALRQTKDWKVVDLRNRKARRRVPCYPFGVKRMLLGLIENAKAAIAHRRGGRRIHLLVDTTKRGGRRYARIRVVDDGSGMHTNARNTIFEGRFTTGKGCHGLGAQDVANVVRDHQGFIEVASTQGKGTVIGILLPAPAVAPKEPDADRDWVEPYTRLASQYPLATRTDLKSLLARDKFVRACYGAGKGNVS